MKTPIARRLVYASLIALAVMLGLFGSVGLAGSSGPGPFEVLLTDGSEIVNVTGSSELTVANTVLSVTGNGTASAAQRVTLASDSSGTLTASAGTALVTSGSTAAHTADFQAFGATASSKFYGFSLAETTASAGATVHLRHGTSDTDDLILTLNLAANESIPWQEFRRSLDISDGLFVEVASGSVRWVAAAATD